MIRGRKDSKRSNNCNALSCSSFSSSWRLFCFHKEGKKNTQEQEVPVELTLDPFPHHASLCVSNRGERERFHLSVDDHVVVAIGYFWETFSMASLWLHGVLLQDVRITSAKQHFLSTSYDSNQTTKLWSRDFLLLMTCHELDLWKFLHFEWSGTLLATSSIQMCRFMSLPN